MGFESFFTSQANNAYEGAAGVMRAGKQKNVFDAPGAVAGAMIVETGKFSGKLVGSIMGTIAGKVGNLLLGTVKIAGKGLLAIPLPIPGGLSPEKISFDTRNSLDRLSLRVRGGNGATLPSHAPIASATDHLDRTGGTGSGTGQAA